MNEKSKKRILNEFKERSWNRGNIALSMEIARRGKEATSWLIDKVGLDPTLANKVSPDGRTYTGRYICLTLYKAAEKRGVKLLFRHKALKLLTDPKRRVVGVRVMTPDGLKNFMAKAVVLATGSFEGDEEMKLKYLGPDNAYAPVSGCVTNTGDGMKMAQEIGAKLTNLSATHIRTPDAVIYSGGPSVGEIRMIYPKFIYININGDRFIDENYSSDFVANIIVHMPKYLVYLVWDEKLNKEHSSSIDKYFMRAKMDSPVPVTREQFYIKADSLEELSKKIKVPYERLKKTVKEFNAAVRSDGTALGIQYPKPKNAVKIDTPPFYAHPVTCALNHSLGGITVNANMQVINTENEVIPGLYACGSTISYHFGQIYYVGTELRFKTSYGLPAGLRYSHITGYFAGEKTAAYAKTLRARRHLDVL